MNNELTKQIRIADFSYELPDERIAKFPIPQRDHSKLLLYRHGEISEDFFYNLPQYLPKDALMVFNNTRVIHARLHFRKQTGALIEVFLLEPLIPSDYELMFQQTAACSWLCLVGNLKKWKEGTLARTFLIKGRQVTLTANLAPSAGSGGPQGSHQIDFQWDDSDLSFAELLDAIGELSIPPYLNRDTQESDLRTYQTVYSKKKGSVAAPTAGLHFTPEVLKAIDSAGIQRQEVTLHVGAGTFKPVKSEEIGGHDMHTEYFSVTRETIDLLIAHHARAIAVGTTSVRTLESLYYIGCKLYALNPSLLTVQAGLPPLGKSSNPFHVLQWEPYSQPPPAGKVPLAVDIPQRGAGGPGSHLSPEESLIVIANYMDGCQLSVLHASTQIIIAPGYEYKYVKALVTNFHQPQSTLLLLVSAFVNGHWREIYDYALAHDFRFLSYGDSSFIIP